MSEYLSREPISVDALIAQAGAPDCGGTCLFLGTVRNGPEEVGVAGGAGGGGGGGGEDTGHEDKGGRGIAREGPGTPGRAAGARDAPPGPAPGAAPGARRTFLAAPPPRP